jgi:hypothetical protein
VTNIVRQYRMRTQDHVEKRAEARQRTLKRGLVTFFGGYCTRETTIRNLSPNGARLDFPDTEGVPPMFKLAIGSTTGEEGQLRTARVRWSSAVSLGVEFMAGGDSLSRP